MSGKRPDYLLKVLDKTTDDYGTIGAAWIKDDGAITIRLNPATILTYNPDLAINLFPNEESYYTKKKGKKRGSKQSGDEDSGTDIPF